MYESLISLTTAKAVLQQEIEALHQEKSMALLRLRTIQNTLEAVIAAFETGEKKDASE